MRKAKIISASSLYKENVNVFPSYQSNSFIVRFTLQPKSKIDSHTTAKSGKKSCSYKANPKSFSQACERSHIKNNIDCIPLNSSVFGQSKNLTLDFTSSNSTPSDQTYDINHTANTVGTVTQRKIELKPAKEKVFSNRSTMKAQRIFCKDPNKRLKNLFTIVKPNEKLSENVTVSKCLDVNLLNKTKKLLVKLIDQELQRVQPDDPANKNVGNQQLDNVIDKSVLKKLKLDCIKTIEDELRLMKRLQNCLMETSSFALFSRLKQNFLHK